MHSLRQLIERQILKARAEGKLEGLQGEGRPLPERPEESVVDPAMAAGYRIMAEAGALPEEFRLQAALDEARADWRAATDKAEKKRLMARIADLEMRYDIARDARKKFMG
ncbi:DnaJ family domain-containing protein [Thalassovita aquimarina]|uniref:DnaJ family domain-containing protein n=1 Tax=Thalassovita aquimarina TaxID=2785917 RepID=UPI003568599A